MSVERPAEEITRDIKQAGPWMPKVVLKNCPFCGSDATINYEADGDAFVIKCNTCPVEMWHDGSEDCLAAMWNTRK